MRVVIPTPEELCALFTLETRTVWLCSPWITSDGVALLRQALEGCDRTLLWEFQLWIRVGDEDRDFTDYPEIDRLLQDLRAWAPDLALSLWTAPRLHAKIIWTDQGALVGSANVTGAGFGPNVELAVRLEPHECRGAASIQEVLRKRMTRVTTEQWKQFVAAPPILRTPTPSPLAEVPPDKSGEMDIMEKLLSRRPEFGGLR